MSIATVVTRGFGLAVGTAFIPTLGFSSVVYVPPVEPPGEPQTVGAYHFDVVAPWKGWPELPPTRRAEQPPPPPPDPRMKDPVHRKRMESLGKANEARVEKKLQAINAQAEARDRLKREHLEDRVLTIQAKQELMRRAKKRWTGH